MPSEFQLIHQYFKQRGSYQGVALGIGDDAALLNVPEGEVLVATTDTFIAGKHFPKNTHPFAIGHKALAVNLSDLAAMGATPRWVLLAITLPSANEFFIKEFANGLFNLANQHKVALVGGDTTKGDELSITITALGSVPVAQALRRDKAKVGDGIYVSGTIGDAGVGLKLALEQASHLQLSAEQQSFYKGRLDFPQPRIALGLALRGLASACLDVSDGLAQDLGHILQASHVGAVLDLASLPLSEGLRALPPAQAWQLALSSGDDYELCFTMPQENYIKLKNMAVPITRIGTVCVELGLVCTHRGQVQTLDIQGYQHF